MNATTTSIRFVVATAVFAACVGFHGTSPAFEGDQIPSSSGIPKIEVSQTYHRFIVTKMGEDLSHDFHFRNVGDADLVIGAVTSSCGCVYELPTDRVIRPGGEGQIRIGVKNETSPRSASVTISTNDPLQKLLLFSVDVEVQKDVELHPDKIHLEHLTNGTETSFEVWLTGLVQVSNIAPSAGLEVTHSKTIVEDWGRRELYNLRVSTPSSESEIRGYVSVSTSSRRIPMAELVVDARKTIPSTEHPAP